MAATDTINDATLKSKANTALTDSLVSYDEILEILNTAKSGGMTYSKFSDLKTVYSAFEPYFASDYVSTISKSLISGNTANLKWWGGTNKYSSVTSLGNLSETTSQDNVGKLIGKWFMGTDLPMPMGGGDAATGNTGGQSYTYATASGSLFVSGAAANDVNQGYLGDCYYVAAIGAIANAQSSYITDMFSDNGNGTYGVKFYLNGDSVYTTVNKSLPVSSGSLIFAGNETKSTSGELWVALAEKAYAQLNSQADDLGHGGSKNYDGENTYNAIGAGGLAAPIKQITNLNYKYYSSYYNDFGDPYDSGCYYAGSASTYKQTIIDALENGAIGWLGSFGNTYENGKKNLVAGHAFMLLGYNSATDKFIIRNPWGDSASSSANIQFEASISDFWNSSVKGVVALSDATTQDKTYSYSLSSSADSTSSAISEGGSVTVTVTRSSSGTAATVYLTTEEKTAGAADFSSLSKYALSFGENQTQKTITLSTLTDSLTEGNEYFNLYLYGKATDATPSSTASIYIKDTGASDYTYTLSSNAQTQGTAVKEGSAATFTVTRNTSGSVSTVYVSTLAGTAGSSDFTALTKQEVTFAANELTKTVSVTTLTDSLTESAENFSLQLYKYYTDETHTATADAYVKDAGNKSSSFKITSSASQSTSAVEEGGQITLTVTRGKSSNAEVVYLSTVDGTANATDYVTMTKKEVYFAPNQTVAQVTVSTSSDWWLESSEYFTTELYKKYADTKAATSIKSYIKDATVDSYNYTVSTSASSSAPVSEGTNLTFTIERSGKGSASTVYVSTAPGSAGSADYTALTKQAVVFSAYETSKTVTVSTLTDSLTESNEYFTLDLYRNYTDTGSTSYTNAYIKDATVASYTYTVSSNASSSTPVSEGGSVTFTVTRSSSGTASTVYVSTVAGSADSTDYTALSKQAVTFAAYETSKSVTVNTLTDSQTEGNEYFLLNLYKGASDSETDYASYGSAYIKDTTAANYSYTVTSSAGSSSKAVTEGNSISFTVTRSSSGSASTVYVSTTPGSAGSSDYTAFEKQAVTFAANQTVQTVTVSTLTDSSTESSEYFWLDLYKNAADTTYSAYASGYLKDGTSSSASYTYTISSSASDTAVSEGSAVSFTITRSSSGSASTVYVSTSDGSAGSADYTALDKQAVTFAAYETSKTVTVSTLTDSQTEGEEYFWLDLYKNAADTDYTTYSYAYLADATGSSNYTYTVSTSASSSAVTEGDAITFTITRSSSGAASTVYVSTYEGSAGSSDYDALTKQAVTFAAYETTKTVTLDTYTDSQTEGEEYFWLLLYGNAADGEFDYSSYAYATLKDSSSSDSYTYEVSSSAGSSSAAVAEGSSITFTITRSSSGTASTVYVNTTASTADSSDYNALDKQAVTFAAYETSKTVTVSTLTDSQTEGSEYFWLDLFKNQADTDYAAYASGYIKDAASTGKSYSYTVTSSASDTAVSEGSAVSFTITRSSSGSASTVYVSTSEGSAGSSDYDALDKYAVSFASYETTKTVTIDTLTDSQTEGEEYFWLDLYKNYSDTTYSTYASAYIKDSATDSYTYSLSTSASSTPVSEGSAITFTVTRSSSGSASTVYVSTGDGSADTSDYTAIEKQAVSFAAYETSKTFSVTTLTDSATEGSEYFWVDLYKNAADTDYNTYAYAYIKDGESSAGNYTYEISSSADDTAVSEGNNITFTITRSGSGAASTVYVSTYEGSAGSSDYDALDMQAVSFAASETSKTVSLPVYTDSQTEGEEYFWLLLYKNASDGVYDYASYSYATVTDGSAAANYTYAVSSSSSSSNAVSEGSDITFTVTRSGSGAASTVYVSTSSSSADSGDYSALDKQAVTFAANATSATVTVSTYTDTLTEGTEYFWLDLYKNAADTSYTSYTSAYIKDGVAANYDYTVTASPATATEGNDITFTITRSGSGSTSTAYVSTYEGAAGSSDFGALDKQAVSFNANETSKTVTVSTYSDAQTEGDEYFWLLLYKNAGDDTFDYSSYAYVTLQDGAATTTNYEYTVSSDYTYTGVAEGGAVTFTITRSGSGAASSVYVSTSEGSAGSSDYTAIEKQAVSFGASDTTQTVTISTKADGVTESTEYFWLDLYKNYADTSYSSFGYAYITDAASVSSGFGGFGASAGNPALELNGVPPGTHY